MLIESKWVDLTRWRRWITSFITSGWLLTHHSFIQSLYSFSLTSHNASHFPFAIILKNLLLIKVLQSVLFRTVHPVCFKSPKTCWPFSHLINHCEKHQLFTVFPSTVDITEWDAYLQDLNQGRTIKVWQPRSSQHHSNLPKMDQLVKLQKRCNLFKKQRSAVTLNTY